MRKTTHARSAVVGLVALLTLVPLQATAQADNDKTYDKARADRLDEEALKLYNTPDAWAKVASLHEKAAALRAPTDPALLYDLQVASSIAASQADFRRAERLMAKMAKAATAVGDVERAAHGYLTAATMAIKAGEGRHALDYVERARLLSYSPLLSDKACECIRSRIGEAAVQVASR